MQPRQRLTPSLKYLIELRIGMTLIALIVLLTGLVLGRLLSLDPKIGSQGFPITLLVTVILDLLWWVPAVLISGPYYRSLSYEIGADEIVMHVGVWTRSVKHVPYRTITNVTVKRGVLDRMFGTGSLDVQTAGISGTNTAEQTLAGLEDAQAVYETVAAQLRRFRGPLGPTAADQEEAPDDEASAETLRQILTEIRAIRQTIEKQGE